VLAEQQRQIVYGLSNAVGELRRAAKVRSANRNRLDAADEQYAAIQNIYQEQDTTIDLVLEAQRRVIESKLQFFQSQVEYMLAVKAVHFEQGTLFQYHNIQFGEADAAFAEFDSLLATDLTTTEPTAQQFPLFIQEAEQELPQDSAESVPAVAPKVPDPVETPSEEASKTPQPLWEPPEVPESDSPKSESTEPSSPDSESDSPIGDAVKDLIPESGVDPDSEPPLRRNMFEEE